MRLQMKDWDGALVAGMDDDSKMLGYYSPEDGWTIHINDVDANSASAGGWQGLTLVHFSAQLERFLWDRGCA